MTFPGARRRKRVCDDAMLTIERENERTTVCDCCGAPSHSVWGRLHEDGVTRCAYLVRWADSGPHPPHITLGYGAWGDGTSATDRVSVYAELKRGRWRFVDHPAPGASPDESQLLGPPIPARKVRKDPRAGEVRETLEHIVRHDGRFPFGRGGS